MLDWDYYDYRHEYKLLSWFCYCCMLSTIVCAPCIIFFNPDPAFISLSEQAQSLYNFIRNYFWILQVFMAVILAGYFKLKSIKCLRAYPANRIPQLFFMLFIIGEFCCFCDNERVFHPTLIERMHFFFTTQLILIVFVVGFFSGKGKTGYCPWYIGATVPIIIFTVSIIVVYKAVKTKEDGESFLEYAVNVAIILVIAVLIIFEEAITYIRLANPKNLWVVPMATRRKWDRECCC